MIVSSWYKRRGFNASGERLLKKEHMDYWKNTEQITDPRGIALGLNPEVEEVEQGFFELLPTINDIWIENPKCNLNLDCDAVKLFRQNRVTLRGEFDSAAEELARMHRLRFIHLDVLLASFGDYFEHGHDSLTLRFTDQGSVYINQNTQCQGSSSGSTGGGEINVDLPSDFYISMTPEEVADMTWYPKTLKAEGKLRALMEKAKEKGGFCLDFS